MNIPSNPAWQALAGHFRSSAHIHMRNLFIEDSRRCSRFSLTTDDLYVDYSKNRIVDETMRLLLKLAEESRLEDAIDAMFRGAKINITEQRAVLHTALRNRSHRSVMVDGEDVMPKVRTVLSRMRSLSEAVRNGHWRGYTGKAITDLVHIGIGGSHLGPMMATTALQAYGKPGIKVHFVSNIDDTDIRQTLAGVNPETTMFIIASKTFTTLETMTNAETARSWFLKAANDTSAVQRHFLAVSTNLPATTAFGIDPKGVFEFWDWVGGRYSLWAAIGLPIAVYIGMDNFEELLSGAYEMDQHFRRSKLAHNAPVILALLGIWYINFFGSRTHAVVPYDEDLKLLPAYLQQLDMESNGKSTDRHGNIVEYATGPVIWGATGTNAQHAFFQSLHQGTALIPADFIAALQSHNSIGNHHEILIANCFAQSEALMRGRTHQEARQELQASHLPHDQAVGLIPHKIFPGNKPSNTILYEKLTPRTLGALLAMYEHKVFVQGAIWGVNTFDQWGVELGKQLAKSILQDFQSERIGGHDCSTSDLIARYRRVKREGKA